MEKKNWYMSKTVWSQVVIIGVGILNMLAQFNVIPVEICNKVTGEILVIAGALGIHGRVSAKTNLK